MADYYHQNFLTTDGATLHYQVHGEGEPAIVLCDGLGCDGFAWKYLLPELRKQYRVVRWHYRGHGASTVEDSTRVGVDYYCADLAALLDVLQIPKAVIFGHSMGVQVALDFHRCHPSRVEGLVLICGSYGLPLDTFHDSTWLKSAFPYLKSAVERFPRASKLATQLVMGTDLAITFALYAESNRALIKPQDLAPYFAHLARMDPLLFVRTLQSIKDHSAKDHLPNVNVPTLVIGGERDGFTPLRLSRKMAATIPDAELLIVPDGSHTAPLEQPELVWHRVDKFLQSRILPANRSRVA